MDQLVRGKGTPSQIMTAVNKRLLIQGIVQGVGFRPTVFTYAQANGLTGWVLNSANGVEIELHGPPKAIEDFIEQLGHQPPPMAQIDSFEVHAASYKPYANFEIIESQDNSKDFLPVSPDLNVCQDCLRELFDPGDRRYRYPFINCTNCGPRFSIVKKIPYDRPNTSMWGFPLCQDCAAEYYDPSDRRFHAQPVACPVCGPHIWFQTDKGIQADGEKAIQTAREYLQEGKILAMKGLGGFHLVCDAQNKNSVATLRERKHRSGKPFALISFDLPTIEKFALISVEERNLLQSVQSPIVLLDPTDTGKKLVQIVAPDQTTLGFMLPYTPLHYLLLEKKNNFPEVLIMTSGNLSEEPIVTENEEALTHLGQIADGFLLHDRPIETRIDDSVVSTIRKKVYFHRRARGYAPSPINLPFSATPAMAVGTHLKNTFALSRKKYAFLSHHIGDLENQETLDAFTKAIDHYQAVFRIHPELIACDLHPDYLATRYAQDRSKKEQLPLVYIQHHHAHISSCLADNGWNSKRPVIGLSFDGTGYGIDGAIWGGEILLANYASFERRLHLEYTPLPGGEVSIRKPARLALAYLVQFGLLDRATGLAPLKFLSEQEKDVVIHQIQNRFNTPLTSSMGRLFDAVAALIGLYQEITYEAQNAIRLETIANPHETSAYELPFDQDLILLKPLFEQILTDLDRKLTPETISAKFHNAILRMGVEASILLRKETGVDHVAISGGVWQNKLLVKKIIPALEKAGFKPLWHHQVPTNDGGLALGQLVSALFMAGLIKE